MTQNYQTIKTNKKITRKLSTAVGFLSFTAFIIQGLGNTYGFQAVAEQLTQTFLLFSGAINLFFLGSTTQKNIEEREKQDEKED